MIQVFKIMKGIDKVNIKDLGWRISDRISRSHAYKLVKERSNLEIRRNYFSQRVVDEWNNLPASVVAVSSVVAFKNKIDKFYKERGIV